MKVIVPVEKKTSKTAKPQSTTDNSSNLIAALSYFWILSVVFYITNKDDEYVVFHAKQGMVLFIISLLGFIPFVGLVFIPINLVLVVASLVGAIKAYQGVKYELPVIFDISKKINF